MPKEIRRSVILKHRSRRIMTMSLTAARHLSLGRFRESDSRGRKGARAAGLTGIENATDTRAVANGRVFAVIAERESSTTETERKRAKSFGSV